jgi:hypothetical protein
MAEIVEPKKEVVVAGRVGTRSDMAYQAYQILHWAFVIAPTVAGLDKFFHVLTNWDQYVAPAIARALPFSSHTLMLIVGVIEIAAGLFVAVKPRIAAYVVTAWLALIVVNLLIGGFYLDVALRDVGLMLGALALGRLSQIYDRGPIWQRRV